MIQTEIQTGSKGPENILTPGPGISSSSNLDLDLDLDFDQARDQARGWDQVSQSFFSILGLVETQLNQSLNLDPDQDQGPNIDDPNMPGSGDLVPPKPLKGPFSGNSTFDPTRPPVPGFTNTQKIEGPADDGTIWIKVRRGGRVICEFDRNRHTRIRIITRTFTNIRSVFIVDLDRYFEALVNGDTTYIEGV